MRGECRIILASLSQSEREMLRIAQPVFTAEYVEAVKREALPRRAESIGDERLSAAARLEVEQERRDVPSPAPGGPRQTFTEVSSRVGSVTDAGAVLPTAPAIISPVNHRAGRKSAA